MDIREKSKGRNSGKRLLSLFLTAALLCGTAAVPSFAVDTSQSYRFEMTAESSLGGSSGSEDSGSYEIDTAEGEILTVTVTLTRTDREESYTVYVVQDNILYDTRYFELVEDSLTAGGSSSSSGIRCSTRDMSSAGAWSGYRQITASAVQAAGRTWSNPQTVMTFQLRALQEGTSQIVTESCLVSNETGTDSRLCESNDLTVRIKAAQGSSGEEQGGVQEPENPAGTPDPSGPSGTGDPDGNSGSDTGDNSGSDTEPAAFADISSHWGREAIEYSVEQGYFSGVTETLFEPDGFMTRGMLVTVLWRKAGSPQVSQTAEPDSSPTEGADGQAAVSATEFTDVADGAWYAEAVKWAASEAIVSGYGDGRFGPEDPVTREQMMVLFSGCAAYDGIPVRAEGDLSSFADAADISVWAQDAVSWGVGEGLMNGTGNNMLSPKGTATRAQAAQLMMLLDEKVYHV